MIFKLTQLHIDVIRKAYKDNKIAVNFLPSSNYSLVVDVDAMLDFHRISWVFGNDDKLPYPAIININQQLIHIDKEFQFELEELSQKLCFLALLSKP